jgi:ABC-type phosphate/phosphonate transport system substrate-binding protein
VLGTIRIAVNSHYSAMPAFQDPKICSGELYPAIALADEGDIVSIVNPDDIFEN